MATVNITIEEYNRMQESIKNLEKANKELHHQLASIDQEKITNQILDRALQLADKLLSKALPAVGLENRLEMPRGSFFEYAWNKRPEHFWWTKEALDIEVTPKAYISPRVKSLWFEITKLDSATEQ